MTEYFLDCAAPMHHNEYALAKWVQERQVFIAAKNDGLRAVVLRFFNAYGPGEYYTPYRSVVCLFCYRLMFGLPITVYKDYHRVFMWAGDWARTVANVAERFDDLPRLIAPSGSRPANVPVYNVGGSEYRSVEDLARLVIDHIPQVKGRTYPSQVRTSGGQPLFTLLDKETANVTNKRPDIALAVRDLGHAPQVTLEQGIPMTVEWMRSVYDDEGRLRAEQDVTTALRLAGPEPSETHAQSIAAITQ